MSAAKQLACDGCGQRASGEHIAKRLRRLEQATRYRPVHIGTLFLGAASPKNDPEFLYGATAGFQGEAELLLRAAGIPTKERIADSALNDFQRGGFFLAHVLECAIEAGCENDGGSDADTIQRLCMQRLPATAARIRRSLKPKRIVPISSALEPLLDRLQAAGLECPILLDAGGHLYGLDGNFGEQASSRLREAVTGGFGRS